MSKVFWDTMLFVYLFEQDPKYSARVLEIFEQMEKRHDSLFTSTLVVGEVLAGFRKKEAEGEATAVERMFTSDRIRVLPFDTQAAFRFSLLRASTKVSSADAIHLACAAEEGIDLFLTHDDGLRGLTVEGIQFIAGLDVQLF